MKKYLILLLLFSCTTSNNEEFIIEQDTVFEVGSDVSVQDIIESTIYFAFDSSNLSQQARKKLTNDANILKKNKDIYLTIEGHCDERGSREYNLALGERRAYAVTKFLVSQGVSKSRITVVSYGEEKPALLGASEKSYSANRRVEIIIN